MVSPIVTPFLLGGAGTAYQIPRSLRVNSVAGAYLTRMPSSTPTSRRLMTFSFWPKRSAVGAAKGLYWGGASGSDAELLYFTSGDALEWQIQINGGSTYGVRTSAVFRDPTAWYHIVVAIDTTQSTAANRVLLYVNNTLQAVTTIYSGYVPQNTDLEWNNNGSAQFFTDTSSHSAYYDGYITEARMVDGQQLTPSSFGETNATTGAWNPKAYTGTYGTNGFYLKFADNSGTTAATLGKDSSGNGNNWTPNNFSVSAGAGNDSLTDTPTNYGTDTGAGGEVRGNYCTLNPLGNIYVASPTLSNGNLQFDTSGADRAVISTQSMASGKWYWEISIDNFGGAQDWYTGIFKTSGVGASPYSSSSRLYYRDGRTYNGSFASYGNSYTTGDLIGVAVDMDNGKIWFAKNGTWQASGDPAAGTNAAFTDLAGSAWFPMSLVGSLTSTTTHNFGQRAFAYTAPSGFKALCTQNLSEGSITTSGSFTGNVSSDGPVVELNGTPTTMTINGNAVTFGTHADKLAGGFKLRTSSASYNASGSNTYSVSATGSKFKYARAQGNP